MDSKFDEIEEEEEKWILHQRPLLSGVIFACIVFITAFLLAISLNVSEIRQTLQRIEEKLPEKPKKEKEADVK